MTKLYPTHKAKTKEGYSKWVQPIRKRYKMACCDCNLVHEFDFRIVKYGKIQKIQFRARRNNYSTAQLRRYRKNDYA